VPRDWGTNAQAPVMPAPDPGQEAREAVNQAARDAIDPAGR
jgi:hypothetical protein